ncbi:hypothetical protein CBR_g39975 [Chara braunii]|uniref:Reverse transcriptase domain-containing protein n=1 Tax=Chara braunii TaxID=69332 RepID=A0A388K1P1_CHABU|nr:hypothetical protein CBR_g39975 [Chara braunii]|eukprot:GBG63970.1 hypothetical protein CBR_g39975 [Chara braunii]
MFASVAGNGGKRRASNITIGEEPPPQEMGFDRINRGKKAAVSGPGKEGRKKYVKELTEVLFGKTKHELEELCKKDKIKYVNKKITSATLARLRAIEAYGSDAVPSGINYCENLAFISSVVYLGEQELTTMKHQRPRSPRARPRSVAAVKTTATVVCCDLQRPREEGVGGGGFGLGSCDTSTPIARGANRDGDVEKPTNEEGADVHCTVARRRWRGPSTMLARELSVVGVEGGGVRAPQGGMTVLAAAQTRTPAQNVLALLSRKDTVRRDKALRENLLRDLGGRHVSMTKADGCPGEGGESELEALDCREGRVLQVVVNGLAEVKVVAMVTLRRQRGNNVLLTILKSAEAAREVMALLGGTAGTAVERGTMLGSVVRGGRSITSTLRQGGGSEASSPEGGLKKIVSSLARALNKNQGYLAEAKKKLTFDGANITEFLIDYENLVALLKWTEEEKMDHLGPHMSLSLGRDIMAIVAASRSWKETRYVMMRKSLAAEKMATEVDLAAVQRKNFATYNDFLREFTLVALRIPGVTDRIMKPEAEEPEKVHEKPREEESAYKVSAAKKKFRYQIPILSLPEIDDTISKLLGTMVSVSFQTMLLASPRLLKGLRQLLTRRRVEIGDNPELPEGEREEEVPQEVANLQRSRGDLEDLEKAFADIRLSLPDREGGEVMRSPPGMKLNFHVLPVGKLKIQIGSHHTDTLVDGGAEITLIRRDFATITGCTVNKEVTGSIRATGGEIPFAGYVTKCAVKAGVRESIWSFQRMTVMEEVDHDIILRRPWCANVEIIGMHLHDGSYMVDIEDPVTGWGEILRLLGTGGDPPREKLATWSPSFEDSTRKGAFARMEGMRERVEIIIEEAFNKEWIKMGLPQKKRRQEDKVLGVMVAEKESEVELGASPPKRKEMRVDIPEIALEIPNLLQLIKALTYHKVGVDSAALAKFEREVEKGYCLNGKLVSIQPRVIEATGAIPTVHFLGERSRKEVFESTSRDHQKGRLDAKLIPPVRIHTVEHECWNDKGPSYEFGIAREVTDLLRPKMDSFVAEPTASPYANRWFVFRKPNKTLRWIQDLQKLNAVTIRDAGSLPQTDLLAESHAGRSIYSLIDLYSGYDQLLLDVRDMPYTAMHTPVSQLQMQVTPMGFTNAVAEAQRKILAVAGDMFPEKCEPYIDDNPIKDAQEKDETEVQPGVRRFVWDHLQDIKDLLRRFLVYNITASGPKSILAIPEINILGFRCGAYGRKPDPAKTDKISQWLTPLRTTTEKGAPAVVAELREGPVTTRGRREEEDSWGAIVGPKEELIAMAVEGGLEAVMSLVESWERKELQWVVNQMQEGKDGGKEGEKFFYFQSYEGLFRTIDLLLVGNKQPTEVSIKAREEVEREGQSDDGRRRWWMDLGEGRYEAANFSIPGGDPGVVDGAVDTRESGVFPLMRERGEIVEVEDEEDARDGREETLIILADGDCALNNAIDFYIIKFPPGHTEKKDMEREGGDEGAGGRMRDDGDEKAGVVKLVEERGRERAPAIRERGSTQELVRSEEVTGTTG